MKYLIYYMNADSVARFITGFRDIPTIAELDKTHTFVCEVKAPSREHVFTHFNVATERLQALVKEKQLSHTSMSVGDVIEDETGELFAVANLGFKSLGRRGPDREQETK